MTRPSTGPVTPLPYADRSVLAAGGSPVAAGVWVMAAGLVLIGFGGCFCIGVMLSVFNGMTFGSGTPAWQRTALMGALYVAALSCFVTGGWVLTLGLRKLLAVGR